MATSTIKPSGGDYTTLTAWESDVQGVLTEPGIAECYYFSGGLDDLLTIAGSTTTSSNYLSITVASSDRHEGKWGTSKFYIAPSSAGSVIYIQDDHVNVDGVQILMPTASTSMGIRFSYISSGSAFYISNNIINGQNSGNTQGVYGSDTDVVIYFWNNIVFGCDRSFFGGWRMDVSEAYLYNNTFFDNYYGIHTDSANTHRAKNNICMNNSNDFNGTFHTDSDYNVSSDSDAPGSNSLINKTSYTDYFVDTSTFDFHLKGNSTSLFGGAGTDLSSDTYLSFSTDIDGDTRSNWDIGADEYVAAGGYTLTAASGDIDYSGAATGLTADRTLSAASGDIDYSGLATSLERGFLLSAATGNFNYAGQDATFPLTRLLTAASGDIDYAGADTTLTYTPITAYTLIADSGNFNYAGLATGLTVDRTLPAASGDIDYAGLDTTLTYTPLGSYSLTADSGGFGYAGLSTGLVVDRTLSAASGDIDYAGLGVSLNKGHVLVTETGNINYAWLATGLSITRLLSAASGDIDYSGLDVSLNKGFILSASSSDIDYAGLASSLILARSITAESGDIDYSGLATTLTYSGETTPVGLASITFAVIKPGVSFTAIKPGVTFTN